MTKKKRRFWSADDERVLRAAAAQKTKTAQVAKRLKRTELATRQKAFSMGLSLDTRRTRRKVLKNTKRTAAPQPQSLAA